MIVRSIDPATAAVIEEFESLSDKRIDAALERGAQVFERHKRSSLDTRCRALVAAAEVLEADKEAWARTLTSEMGKTLRAAMAEVEKCAWVCRYYAEHAESFLADVEIATDAKKSYVTHQPLGAVLAVMPWNFPFWQVFRFAAPALTAGNTVLLKHASNVPRSALALQSVFERAGYEPGVFQTLLIDSGKVETILSDRRVAAATVTGSERAGTSVAGIAGRYAKKTVLELGGSDAFVVMPSADLDEAVDAGVTSRVQNNGQSCIAAKRFIVHHEVFDRFVAGFAERMDGLQVGNPLDEETDVGPLAMARSRERLETQVEDLVANGATRVMGARPLEGPGHYYRPGVLTDIPMLAAGYREEIFGPVALILKAPSFEHAIDMANDTRYGLGSSIWTRDEREAAEGIEKLEAGATFVNAMVKSDPRLPFGGVRASGHGRELAKDGILEFVNRKAVYRQ